MALLLFCVCLFYSNQHRQLTSQQAQLELFALLLYGFFLEALAVVGGFYTYGAFNVQIWGTPLLIAFSWAVICFSVMSFSDALNTSEWSKPFIDALLALLIDLSMDAVAIRTLDNSGEALGMWNWDIPLEAEWFGVPYANLIGWWIIVFLGSSMLRLGRYLSDWFLKPWLTRLYPFLAAFTAFLFIALFLPSFFSALGAELLLLIVVLSFIVIALNTRGFSYALNWVNDAPVFLVPLAFHLFFLSLLIAEKMYLASPFLIVISSSVFLLSEVLFWLSRHTSKKQL